MADYGLLNRPSDDIINNWLYQRSERSEVTPDSRAGRMPDSYGLLSNPAPRPMDWHDRTGVTDAVAGAVNPMVIGYGAGQMAGHAGNALMDGDYGSAAGLGTMAAMGLLPGWKGKPAAVAEREAAAAPTGIRAYHGSPHDFDKFDISKIGTGEGAQAFGHGLYFAEREGVAKSYRDTLSNKAAMSADMDYKNPDHVLATMVGTHGDNRAAMISDLERDLGRGSDPNPGFRTKSNEGGFFERRAKQQAVETALDRIKSGAPLNDYASYLNKPGRMYEVNIKADPEHFLDWDKPLSGQSGPAAEFAKKNLSGYGPPERDPLGMTGAEFYRGLDSPKQLQDAGVAGIKYLDQGSRTAGEGSRNYVVFDPATIEIMRKYGLLGPMAGGVGANALYGNDQ